MNLHRNDLKRKRRELLLGDEETQEAMVNRVQSKSRDQIAKYKKTESK